SPLETEPRLHLYHTGTKRAGRLAEVCVIDLRHDSIGPFSAIAVQVQLVKQIEKVGSNLHFCAFAENLVARQPKRLGERCIHIEIARATERVARNSRSSRNWAKTLLSTRAGDWIRIREEAREQSPGNNGGWRKEA